MDKDQLEFFVEMAAWPASPKDGDLRDFPTELLALLRELEGVTPGDRQKFVATLKRWTKAELVETLANATCAAVVHHALLRLSFEAGKSAVPIIERTKKGPRAGGKATARKKAKDAAVWHQQCVNKAMSLLRQGKSPRELAAVLAPQFDVTPKTINNVLKKAKVK